MRIGMLVDVYKPHVSGVTNYISINKRMLTSLGHEVFVFTFGDLNYSDDETNVVRSPGLAVPGTGYYLSLRYSAQASRLLKTMDLVHVHHPFVSGPLALRYSRPQGIPVIFTNHTRYDLYTQAYLPGLPDIVGEALLQTFMPSFCRACDLVISPSQGMKSVLERMGVDSPIDVLPNGVDLRPFGQPIDPLGRHEFGFENCEVLLIYTGRLGPEKNMPFLLRAFAGALHAYDNACLLIVGDGPERKNLENQVQDMGLAAKIHFTGMIPYEQMPRYLLAADGFVTASVTEVHPLSVIEAMAAGLPVLGIQSPGVGDTVEDGQTGFLAPDEDMATFTAKMVRMIVETEERRKLGKAARQAAGKYAIERTVCDLLERYERVLANAAGKKRKLRSRLFRVWSRWRRPE